MGENEWETLVAAESELAAVPVLRVGAEQLQLPAGKVPAVNPGMKLQGARLMVVRSQPEGAQIEALVDQQKLNHVIQ